MKQWGVGSGGRGGEIFWPQLKTMLKREKLLCFGSARVLSASWERWCKLGECWPIDSCHGGGRLTTPYYGSITSLGGIWLRRSMGFSWGNALAQQSQQIMFLSGCRCSFTLAPHSHVLPCFTPAGQSRRLLLGCIVCWLRQKLFTSSCATADKTWQHQNQNTDPQQATFGIFTEPVPQKLLLIAPMLDLCSNYVWLMLQCSIFTRWSLPTSPDIIVHQWSDALSFCKMCLACDLIGGNTNLRYLP